MEDCPYKSKYSLEKRQSESEKIMNKYPNRVPVIISRSIESTTLKEIKRSKYLVPNDLTVASLIHVIRKIVDLGPEDAIFLMVNDTLVPTSEIIGHVYDIHKDEDGFLYIIYSSENTFGGP